MAGSAISLAKGDAVTSTKLKTAQTIGISGIITGTATSFNGSVGITIPVTALNLAAAGVTGTLPISLGGTGATTAAGIRTNIGATTLGSNLFTIPNTGAIRFIRINADNTVSALSDADFRLAIGAGTGMGGGVSVAYTEIVATANQTVFPVVYTASDVLVYLNGVKLNAADYTASNGTSITLTTGALAGSVLSVRSYSSIPTALSNDNIVVLTANTALLGLRTYVVRSAVTLTLPSAPSSGEWVNIINRSGGNITLLRGSNRIMGLLEDLVLNIPNVPVSLTFTDATDGWVLK